MSGHAISGKRRYTGMACRKRRNETGFSGNGPITAYIQLNDARVCGEQETTPMTDRRDFIRKTALCAAGFAALSTRRIFGQAPDGYTRVVYRELGSTGFKASEVGFGAMNMRDPELVQRAIDSGVNYIDTAHSYMNGVNEQVVGQVMKTERKKVFLSTKIPKRPYADILSAMETSLKRLQTDHVDLCLLHNNRTAEEILQDDYLKAFEEMKRKGMTRFIGISVHTNQAEVVDAAVESGIWEAVLVGYNYLSPPSVGEAIERARKSGLAVIAMKNILNQEARPWTPIEGLDESGALTPAQSLIKWALRNPYVDTTVPGITSFEQLADDIALMGMRYTLGDDRTLRRYGERMDNRYCRGVAGCTGCSGQCPYGVDVRDLNRCIRYAYGYGDPRLAWENYRELPVSSRIDRCGDCETCAVKCVHGLDLTEHVRQARNLFG